MKNTQSRKVTYTKGASLLARRSYFKIGYDAAMKNLAYDYSIEDRVDAINYARGRSFAIWSMSTKQPSCRWKNGVLSRAGQERLLQSMYDRAVI